MSYSIHFGLKDRGVFEVARGMDKEKMQNTFDKYEAGDIPAYVYGDMMTDITQADILAISLWEIETAEDGRIIGKGLVKRHIYMDY